MNAVGACSRHRHPWRAVIGEPVYTVAAGRRLEALRWRCCGAGFADGFSAILPM